MSHSNRSDDHRANRDPSTRARDSQPELRAQYQRIKGKSRLAWDDAKSAAKAAWHRVEQIMPGDLDNDGR